MNSICLGDHFNRDKMCSHY